jgi:pimeloyl-ACP methyl ester carboxylesterase
MRVLDVSVADAAVAVHDTEGAGPPVVLCHGNSCSSRCFRFQLEGRLGRRFRLIAIDLPGHGDSAPARTPRASYTLPGYAEALVEVARQTQATRAAFVGWSLGGHVVMEAMPRLTDASGFLLFGAPPIASNADMARAFSADPALQAVFREDSTDQEVAALVSLFFKPGRAVPASFVEDFRRTDKRARSSLAASLARGEFADEVRIVAGLAQPLAVLHGSFEACMQRPYVDQVPMPTLWRGAIQEVPDAGHTPQWEAPARFDELLEAFVLDAAARSS